MLGVKGPLARADAYGVVTAAPFDDHPRGMPTDDLVQRAISHLIIQVNQHDRGPDGAGAVSIISFDEADIEGTFHSQGHPGVIGLWLTTFTVAGTVSDPIDSATFDPTPYEVPDLQPAANGWMYRRGEVWEPPYQRRDYP
jgi:hypothetical protein